MLDIYYDKDVIHSIDIYIYICIYIHYIHIYIYTYTYMLDIYYYKNMIHSIDVYICTEMERFYNCIPMCVYIIPCNVCIYIHICRIICLWPALRQNLALSYLMTKIYLWLPYSYFQKSPYILLHTKLHIHVYIYI